MEQRNQDTVESLRKEIDRINREITALYMERIGYASRMAAVKRELGLPVYDARRENETIERMCALVPEAERPAIARLFALLMQENRIRQEQILAREGGETK